MVYCCLAGVIKREGGESRDSDITQRPYGELNIHYRYYTYELAYD